MNVQFAMLAFVVSICIALAWAATRYVHDATMDGLNCRIGDTVFTMMADSTLVCALSCEITATCKSWFYSSTSKDCYECNNSYYGNQSLLSGNASTKFYRNGDTGWLSKADVATGSVWVTNPALNSSRYHVGTTAGPMGLASARIYCEHIGGYPICLGTDVEIDIVKGYLLNRGADDNVGFWTSMHYYPEEHAFCKSIGYTATEDWAPSVDIDLDGYIALKRELEYQWAIVQFNDKYTALCEMD